MFDLEERRIGGLTITIDRMTCIGSRNCIKVAPEVFQLDADGIVTFTKDSPDIGRERLIESCLVCPVDALRYHE
ncbi:MAG TPA: ferredoxin [Thermoanaerobaculia bacterium]|nr:ferredoxin [Thermoanaerobaculia bacterium]